MLTDSKLYFSNSQTVAGTNTINSTDVLDTRGGDIPSTSGFKVAFVADTTMSANATIDLEVASYTNTARTTGKIVHAKKTMKISDFNLVKGITYIMLTEGVPYLGRYLGVTYDRSTATGTLKMTSFIATGVPKHITPTAENG